jgi:hypothetical protein
MLGAMPKPVALLVCGNAGAVGGELLRRRDVVTYWTLTPEETVAVAKHASPDVILVREDHAPAVLEGARSLRSPVIVLLENDGWSRRQDYFSAGATALVQATAGPRILEAISELTGLTFARLPRVLYETAVEVEIGGQARLLNTVNLSASGVCIEGIRLEEQALGARVSFPLLEPPLTLEALVVRTHHDGRHSLGGLAFVNPSAVAQDRLRALVEAEISRDEKAAITVEVPEHLDPISMALDEVKLGGDEAVEALKNKLRDLHLESKRDGQLHARRAPPRTGSVASRNIEAALSPSERALVLGEPSPDWAGPALHARLKLHVERRERGAPSPRTVQDALTLCRTLGRGAADAPAVVEVAAVRASLLREVYADAPRSRHGAASNPPPAVTAHIPTPVPSAGTTGDLARKSAKKRHKSARA